MNDRIYNSGIDRLRNPERVRLLEVERVIDICLKNKNIKSVLDIGTGSGLFAEAFFKKNVRTAGVDLKPEMVEAAMKLVPGAEFRTASAENLPYDDNSFDIVFMGLLLHEASDCLQVINEAKRVALKGVYILEWQYKTEEFGPPLEHRLKSEFVQNLSEEAGFKKFEIITLKNLILYRMLKEKE